MAKYDALRDELKRRRPAVRVTMSFVEIDRLVPGGLPKSALTLTGWWCNHRDPTRNVHRFAWQQAGYKVVRVSISHRTVSFLRI